MKSTSCSIASERDEEEDFINKPPSKDEMEETKTSINHGTNSLFCFPGDNGVDSNKNTQHTSEAAVMKKIKTFGMFCSNIMPQNIIKGRSDAAKLKHIEGNLCNKRKEIHLSESKSKISSKEESITEPPSKKEQEDNPMKSNSNEWHFILNEFDDGS
eukprot:10881859-Ditylum_brightwellii.AAC.1